MPLKRMKNMNFINNNRCCCGGRRPPVVVVPITRTEEVVVAGPVGPTGPTGVADPTGPIGPTGATGVATVSDFGSYFTTASQSVDNTTFPLTNTLQASTLTIDNATGVVTIPNAGMYRVDYGVYAASNVTAGDSVSLSLNGTNITGTERGLENNTFVSASAIVETTTPNSTLAIQINSAGPITFFDNDGTNGYLVITRLA